MTLYWQEEEQDTPFVVPDRVVDLVFDMRCRMLPVDHAEGLFQAISEVLPWFGEEAAVGLHLVHGAESGNGWERPEDGTELIYLSRRTKLTLRLPRERVEAAAALSGCTLRVAGYDITLGESKQRLLSTHSALYARHVVCDDGQEEDDFLAWVVGELKGQGINFKKVLCGKMHTFSTREGEVTTRSLFLADLSPGDSVRAQERGIGPGRERGFGLFIPHKTIKKV